MITRFYVDNYKSLVNFEYKPKPFELIIGGNGSGKTTVFEALDKIKRFVVEGEKISDVFSSDSTTRWQYRREQVFELEMFGPIFDRNIIYRLVVENGGGVTRVKSECLSIDGTNTIETFLSQSPPMPFSKISRTDELSLVAKVYGMVEKEPFTLSNPDYSAMALASGAWIRDELENTIFLRLEPAQMVSNFEAEQEFPARNFSNFSAYYSHVLQEEQGKAFELTNKLREVLENFSQFSLPRTREEGRQLFLSMNQPTKDTRFSFGELSDGQRALIALYTLLECTLKKGVTIIIDEPENYIALRELQPLIVLMEERVKETGGQILLISHNQEFINMLTDRGNCTRFFRENNGHTRVVAFNPTSDLTPAEIVARGWEADE